MSRLVRSLAGAFAAAGVTMLTLGCGASSPAGVPAGASPTPSTRGSAGAQTCATQAQPPGTPGAFTESNGGTIFRLTVDGCGWGVTTSPQASSTAIVGTWSYAPSTGEVSFTETSGPCGPVTGTYTWALTGDRLKMAKVSDICTARSDQFSGYVWARAG